MSQFFYGDIGISKKRCNDAAEKMSQSVFFFFSLYGSILLFTFLRPRSVPLHAVAARIARAARYTATASFPPIFLIFPHLRIRGRRSACCGRNEKYRQKERKSKERRGDFLRSSDPAWAERPHVTGKISGKNKKKSFRSRCMSDQGGKAHHFPENRRCTDFPLLYRTRRRTLTPYSRKNISVLRAALLPCNRSNPNQ